MTPLATRTEAASRPPHGNAERVGKLPPIPATDGERLLRFRQHRDEAAFHEVVRTHAPLVWGICWQVLRHREDVEDAFQATFLILARKAGSIRAADSAAGWLYRVAFRTALAARQRRRRQGIEPLVDDPPGPLEEQLAAIERAEQCEALLEELHALAVRYREPLVLCYLEGRSRQEAADQLGVTLASVKGRLARGLRMLRTRMGYRGLTLSSAAALLTSELAAAQASIAATPIAEAAALGASFAWAAPAIGVQNSTAPAFAPGAITLANKGILAMKIAAAAKPAIGLLAVGMTAGALALASAIQPAGDGGADSTAVVELVAGDAAVVSDDGMIEPAGPNTFFATGPAIEDDTVLAAGTLLAAAAAQGGGDSSGSTPRAVRAPTTDALPAIAPAPDAAPVPTLSIATEAAVAPPLLAAPPQPARVRLQPLETWPIAGQQLVVPTPQRSASREVMKLEHEYWTLKGRGLRLKAEALNMKAASLDSSGAATRVETLEAYAEAELTEAEAVLCDARAKELEESLEQPENAAANSPDLPDVLIPTHPTPAPAETPPAASIPGPAFAALDLAPGAANPSAEPTPEPMPDTKSQNSEFEAVAAQLRKQYVEARRENEELRREVEELRRAIEERGR